MAEANKQAQAHTCMHAHARKRDKEPGEAHTCMQAHARKSGKESGD